LLANLTMAWTTHHLQQVVDQWTRDGHPVREKLLRHIAPVHVTAINFRGTFHFPLERYAKRLIPERNRHTAAS
jgi:Tn3 transposase DDE domain-containing protein